MMVSVFTPDEAFQSVTLREACYGGFAVLADPACAVAGHPGVEDAIWLVSQYVNPTTPHAVVCKSWMAGTSPAMTVEAFDKSPKARSQQ